MIESSVSLDDRYTFLDRPYYLTGTQSLVRLVLLEKRRRQAQGRHTGVFVSGYRGSPLGSFDQALQGAARHLGEHIKFQPGVNEDIAATAVWGTQQLGTFAKGPYEGVSALWYGKGPGVDRSGDVFKHGNLAGSARQGGVLVVAGDDHTCKSSTTAHQSEYALAAAMIPVLAPASIAEQIELGLIGWELSRATGLWVGMKVVTEIMDSGESLAGDPVINLINPLDDASPPGGFSLRWPDSALAQEERLHRHKLPAALSYVRANRLDRTVWDSPNARIGIISVGKAYADTRQALSDLGIDERRAAQLGMRLYKVAMPWPLEPAALREFSAGLQEIIVVEEKRGLVEDQVRQHLYGLRDAPQILGKHDERGAWLLPSNGDLGADLIARVLAERITRYTADDALVSALKRLESSAPGPSAIPTLATRPPHFCPGCPHSTSTKVPEGSTAFAGIGCHYLVLPMERSTAGFTHMGGEGANWIGLSPFCDTRHVFQNIGDGTYFHSGSLAIRAAVAAKVNITYKILYNQAVAMTGGQPVDGELTLSRLASQVVGEGVSAVVLVSEDPSRHAPGSVPASVSVRHRDELDAVQRELREVVGVSVLIYDQACATEVRRLRKRGKLPDPKRTILINELVCEGCGDCSKASNCLAVVPLQTEFGRKRAIDQSACNKDQSCIQGFCPSFVTVEGGTRRAARAMSQVGESIPEPGIPELIGRRSLIVAGIGGTGVVTIGALIGMAAHMEGKSVRVMDMTGLAQKGGAVVTHIQIAATPAAIHAAKISDGAADAMIACDLVVAAMPDNLRRVSKAAHIIANNHETPTGPFTRDPTLEIPNNRLARSIQDAVPDGGASFCDATELASMLVGDAVGANLFLVGFAWQRGLLPLALASIKQAIELNGVSIEMNKAAFGWGRRAALDLPLVESAATADTVEGQPIVVSVEEMVSRRASFLREYQDEAYAARYRAILKRVREAEDRQASGRTELTTAVAQSLFRLMAYKDEYEVARLHSDAGFKQRIDAQFEGPVRLYFHLAPPLLAPIDPATGTAKKIRFGAWIRPVFRVLAAARRLRGTVFDPFGYTAERRQERKMIDDFLVLLERQLLPELRPDNYADAVALAELPQAIKGFGHVKARNIQITQSRQVKLLDAFMRSSGEH